MPAAYDAIIIGTGQAGPALAGRLTAAGMKTAIRQGDGLIISYPAGNHANWPLSELPDRVGTFVP